jgi:DHA2 family multidrug resistance protein
VGDDGAGRAVVGPLLGGWITDNISWPWIFYINIPVGIISAAITWSIYRNRDPGPRRVKLDYVGLGLLVVWVGALQIMIDKGKELDWFGSTRSSCSRSLRWSASCSSWPGS